MSTSLQTTEQHEHGLWSYISASRLNLWAKCPLAFRYRYIDGIVTPCTPNLFLGKVVHAALETYYRRRQIGVLSTPDTADELAESAWHATSEAEPMLWDASEDSVKCRKQATELVRAYVNEFAEEAEYILAMETSLETPLTDPDTGENLGVPLFGIVDLVLERNDNITLVDFKTAASASAPTEQAHAVQLTLYSVLLQGNGYEHVETEIRQLVKTKTPKICTHRFGERNERQLDRFFALCREYLDSLDRGTFNYRPCWSCSMCDYRHLCE